MPVYFDEGLALAEEKFQKTLNRMKREQSIKEKLSKEVLSQIQDKSVQNIIRSIIFSEDSKIDWEKVEQVIKYYMPELTLKQ